MRLDVKLMRQFVHYSPSSDGFLQICKTNAEGALKAAPRYTLTENKFGQQTACRISLTRVDSEVGRFASSPR